jgi:hypothetical protein
MFEPLLLANPDTNTLRPVRSRASTNCRGTRTASRVFAAAFFGALADRALLFGGLHDRTHIYGFMFGGLLRGMHDSSRQLRPDASAWAVSWWLAT